MSPERTASEGSELAVPRDPGLPEAVEIYDTTLRDGAQGEGVSFSGGAKLKLARRLDEFGVHYVEGGYPGSNQKDIAFFDQMRRQPLVRARLVAFGSTRRARSRPTSCTA